MGVASRRRRLDNGKPSASPAAPRHGTATAAGFAQACLLAAARCVSPFMCSGRELWEGVTWGARRDESTEEQLTHIAPARPEVVWCAQHRGMAHQRHCD